MKRVTFLKTLVVLALCCLSLAASAIDTNPQNPVNWQRTMEFIGAEKHIINIPDGSDPDFLLNVQDWAISSGPFPDPVISSIPFGASGTRTVHSENQGLIRVKLKWVGVGAPPSTVNLNVHCFVRQIYGNVTNVDSNISNGLGDSVSSSTFNGATTLECDGTHLRSVLVSGDTATVEIQPINNVTGDGTFAAGSSVQVETDWSVTFP